MKKSESGEKCAQINHCLQVKTVWNGSKQICWWTTGDGLLHWRKFYYGLWTCLLITSDSLKYTSLNFVIVSPNIVFPCPYVNWWSVDYLWIIVKFLSAVWSLILTAPIRCRGSTGGVHFHFWVNYFFNTFFFMEVDCTFLRLHRWTILLQDISFWMKIRRGQCWWSVWGSFPLWRPLIYWSAPPRSLEHSLMGEFGWAHHPSALLESNVLSKRSRRFHPALLGGVWFINVVVFA